MIAHNLDKVTGVSDEYCLYVFVAFDGHLGASHNGYIVPGICKRNCIVFQSPYLLKILTTIYVFLTKTLSY